MDTGNEVPSLFQQIPAGVGVTNGPNGTNTARLPMRHISRCRRQCCKTHYLAVTNWSSTQPWRPAGLLASRPLGARCPRQQPDNKARPISAGGASAMDPAKCLEILGNRGSCSGMHGAHHHGHAAAGVLCFLKWQDCQVCFFRRLPQREASAPRAERAQTRLIAGSRQTMRGQNMGWPAYYLVTRQDNCMPFAVWD